MSLYRVLVAHNGYRVNELIETDTPVLRYVKEVENATDRSDAAGPGSGDVGADNPGADLPRKSRKRTKPAEVNDEPDRAVSDGGLPNSES